MKIKKKNERLGREVQPTFSFKKRKPRLKENTTPSRFARPQASKVCGGLRQKKVGGALNEDKKKE